MKGDEVNEDFQSKFLTDAEKMKLKMDKVSPSLCLAKWKQVSLHLQTGRNNSCYHPPLHKISIEDIAKEPSALHNTFQKKSIQGQMLTGARPSECSYCWAMEDAGNLSDRHYRSGERWASESFNDIVDDPFKNHIPSYVEVNFNNACNLACSYCSPQFSSSWMREVKEHGGYDLTKTTHNDPTYFVGSRRPIPHSEYNPYVEAFWKWWPDLYPELKHFRMTGGEPLMDKNTYKVFDYVLEHPKPDLHLNVTSNFSVEEKLWVKYLDKVKQICQPGNVEHFMQYVSVDTWGHQAEYLRHGLDFDLLWKRVNQFLTEVPNYSSITFIITMSNLSIVELEMLMTGILGLRKKHSKTFQRVWFDTPVLRSPDFLSMQVLPRRYASLLEDTKLFMQASIETEERRFKGFKDYEIQRLQRDIDWMKEGTGNTDQHMADFFKFFDEADSRHGTSFIETFPELKTFWEECFYHATK